MDYQAQQQARQAALRECNEACEAQDAERIKQLFGRQSNPSQGGTHTIAPKDVDGQDRQASLEPDDALDCLIWMVDENDLPVSRCHLELGIIDLHKSPIRLLTKAKSQAMLELLAEFGFDFGQYGHNILHKFLTPISTLSYLLDQGADPNKPVTASLIPTLKRGETDDTIQCLNLAAEQCNIPAFELLVSSGADPRRSIALHRATRFKGPTDGDKTVTAMIDYLLDVHDLDPNADDDCGGLRMLMTSFREEGTPLEYALANENHEAAVALVKKGADPERICSKNKIDKVKRFIEGM
ncbi:hypothetical protein V8F20_009027 [Naviculisporaceae sp. PSN 640]